jgi:hypothetical protein
MENIVIQTLGEISTVLLDSGVEMDSWRSDAIHKILVLAFNRCFQEGRSAGLRDVLALLEVKGVDFVKKI